MFSLHNKKAVITGGGSGIGKAIATLFAKKGAEVHIIELTEESAQEAVTEITLNYNSYVEGCRRLLMASNFRNSMNFFLINEKIITL